MKIHIIKNKFAPLAGWMSCIFITAINASLAVGANADSFTPPPNLIAVGSFLGETGFDPKLKNNIACQINAIEGCEYAATAALFWELKAGFEDRLEIQSEFTLGKLENSPQSMQTVDVPTLVFQPEVISPNINIFADAAFELKIPLPKHAATILRNLDEKAKPKFSFSNSYAFLEN